MATPVLAGYVKLPECGINPGSNEKCFLGPGTPASTNDVTPDHWNDNPSCENLGFDNGIRFDCEIYDCTTSNSLNGISWSSDGTSVDWSSIFGINAVIMKGGNTANVYVYDPASTGDSGLESPLNTGGNIPELSHVDFCYNNKECDCPVNDCSTGTCDQAGACIFEAPGTGCDGGVCDGEGNCESVPIPEFPSLALPVALVIGIAGLVYAVKTLK